MRNKTLQSMLLAGGLMLAATGVSAALLPSLSAGGYYFNYSGAEQFNPYAAMAGANGQTFSEANWGLVQVNSIFSASGTDHKTMTSNGGAPVWVPGTSGGQIYGIFYNVGVPNGNGNATGGQMDLYWIPYANANLSSLTSSSPTSKMTAINQFTGITDVIGATRLAHLDFTTGSAYYGTDANWKNITVDSRSGNPYMGYGSASSYLNAVAGTGAWADAAVNSNWFQNNGAVQKGNLQTNYAGYADMLSNDSYTMLSGFNDNGDMVYQSPWDNPGNGTIGLQITSGSVMLDFTQATNALTHDTVPEPGTLASLSLGLAALSFVVRRRKS
ncbi:MAG: PEP-CTERM sorting domain-containing protein [Rhodocyclaceae bacterium]|nr:PEP-CTERM sorting domain-containing protein [Rhodocyclaceae bacterium]